MSLFKSQSVGLQITPSKILAVRLNTGLGASPTEDQLELPYAEGQLGVALKQIQTQWSAEACTLLVPSNKVFHASLELSEELSDKDIALALNKELEGLFPLRADELIHQHRLQRGEGKAKIRVAALEKSYFEGLQQQFTEAGWQELNLLHEGLAFASSTKLRFAQNPALVLAYSRGESQFLCGIFQEELIGSLSGPELAPQLEGFYQLFMQEAQTAPLHTVCAVEPEIMEQFKQVKFMGQLVSAVEAQLKPGTEEKGEFLLASEAAQLQKQVQDQGGLSLLHLL